MAIKSRGQFLCRSLGNLRAQSVSVTAIWAMLKQGIHITEKSQRHVLGSALALTM